MTTFKSMSASEALKTIEEMVEFTRYSVENTMQASSRAAAAGYHHAMASTEENIDVANATGNELTDLHQGTMKAALQSSTMLFDGMQELTRQWISSTHETLENGIAHGKAVRGAKGIHDLAKMNRDFARSSANKVITDATRLGEEGIKLAEQAAKPFSLHISDHVIPRVNEQLAMVLKHMIKNPNQ